MAEYQPLTPEELDAQANRMLRAIGFDSSWLMQARICARLPAAVKVEQMLRLRDLQVQALRDRIQQEQPYLTPRELDLEVLDRLHSGKRHEAY